MKRIGKWERNQKEVKEKSEIEGREERRRKEGK